MPPSRAWLLLVRLRSWTTCLTEVRLASSPNQKQISTIQRYCHHLLLWRGCRRVSLADRRKEDRSPPSSRPASPPSSRPASWRCRKDGFWKVAAGRKPPLSSCPAPVQQKKKQVFIMLKALHLWNLEELASLEHHWGVKYILCLDHHLHLDRPAPVPPPQPLRLLENHQPLISWKDILGLGHTHTHLIPREAILKVRLHPVKILLHLV